MWMALLVLALVGLVLGGSLMTLKYTARLGLPRIRRDRDHAREADGEPHGPDTVKSEGETRSANRAAGSGSAETDTDG